MKAIFSKNTLQSVYHCLMRTFWLGLVIILISSGYWGQALAQSVEKADTSQQAKRSEDELQLAREAVTKPSKDKTKNEIPGSILGDFSVMTSIEVGYRFTDVNGNRNTYLSDVNVRDGLRLLDYSLDMRSISGHAPLFDFLRADISNAGGDQSQYFSLRMDKTRAYKFDATVRRFNYFRDIPTFALGQHNQDLRRQISDFNLKLFPQRKVKVNLYYGRSMAKGPFLSTYDYERDEFPIVGTMRWESNDYRIGVDMTLHHWNFFFEQMFRDYRNDTEQFLPSFSKGNQTTNLTVLNTFLRELPTRTFGNVSRMSISGNITPRAHLVLRGLYGNESLKVTEFEETSGVDYLGNKIIDRRILDKVRVKRPSVTADAVFTYDVTDHISLSDSFRFVSYRIAGDLNSVTQSLLQPPTGPPQPRTVPTLASEFSGVSSVINTFQANFSVGQKFSANLGLRTLYRDVTLHHYLKPSETETETTNTFLAGIRYRPVKQVNFFLDYEEGKTNNAFVRVTPLDFRQVRFRANFKPTETLSLNFTLATTDRTNPTRFVENDSDSRVVAFSAFWQPNSRVWLSGGYDYNYFFSTADIAYFINNVLKKGRSVYYSRQNFVFFDTRLAITKRLDLLLAYRFTNDLGAPSRPLSGTIGPDDFVAAFPLSRHNPEVRVAYRFSNHITGNVSYRHYSYNERDRFVQDYRANIVTTSLRFTF